MSPDSVTTGPRYNSPPPIFNVPVEPRNHPRDPKEQIDVEKTVELVVVWTPSHTLLNAREGAEAALPGSAEVTPEWIAPGGKVHFILMRCVCISGEALAMCLHQGQYAIALAVGERKRT